MKSRYWYYAKLSPQSRAYADAAPAVCCGVCKPCVTSQATGLVVAATGAGLAAVKRRKGKPA
jgi:hypothetical protein